MRKWLSSVVLIVIIIALLLPLLFGFFAKRRCQKVVDIINATTPLYVKILNYERGWFSSEATTLISLDKLDLPNKELYQLTITADINHGPLLIDWTKFYFLRAMVDATISLNETQNRWLNREAKTEPIATVKIKFKLNGKTNLTVDSPSLICKNADVDINWQGLRLRSIYSPSYTEANSTLELAGFNIKTKERTIHLGETISNYQGHKTSNGFWLGERSLQCKFFSTTNDNNRTIAFDNLNIHSLTTANEKDRANINTLVDVSNLNINGATYTQNKLDLEINKIDQSGLVKLNQQLISSKVVYSPSGALFDGLMAALNSGSEIYLKELDTSTPWGRLIANIKMSFANQPNNIGIFALLAGSTINTNVKVEPALALHLLEKFYQHMPLKSAISPAKQAEISLTNWKKSGKIITSQEDPYLHLTFEYKDNHPAINGKQLILTFQP